MSPIEQKLEYTFQNPELLYQALTHRSFDDRGVQNEVLEFLGDAVLGLAISDMLIAAFPNDDEGPLSRRRASLVNADTLAEIATQIELGGSIRLGKGEILSGGATKPRLLASALEAVIGAIYTDSGFDSALRVIRGLFQERVQKLSGSQEFELDFKTRLQELTQKLKLGVPKYVLLDSQGPDHAKEFLVSVEIDEIEKGRGLGKNKKLAEQMAAQTALHDLRGKEL